MTSALALFLSACAFSFSSPWAGQYDSQAWMLKSCSSDVSLMVQGDRVSMISTLPHLRRDEDGPDGQALAGLSIRIVVGRNPATGGPARSMMAPTCRRL